MAKKERFLNQQYKESLARKTKENEYIRKQNINQLETQNQKNSVQYQTNAIPQSYEIPQVYQQMAEDYQRNNQLKSQQYLQKRKPNKFKIIFAFIVYGFTLFVMVDYLFGLTQFNYNKFLNDKMTQFGIFSKDYINQIKPK
jgi:hypothetical protein